jgi:hypothetical protein
MEVNVLAAGAEGDGHSVEGSQKTFLPELQRHCEAMCRLLGDDGVYHEPLQSMKFDLGASLARGLGSRMHRDGWKCSWDSAWACIQSYQVTY